MEAERLIRAAEVHLRTRDYAGSRSSAVEAMQLDPTITGAEQIIAICDVFLSQKCTQRNPNWYSILKLEPFTDDDDLIVEQFRNLSTLLFPSRNNYSHAFEAYKIVKDAFRVLSSEEKKLKYDEELKGKEGFCTMCPFCYWVFEYEKMYVDFCLRCQNCSRGFQAVEIDWPPGGEAGSDGMVGFMPFGVYVKEGKKDNSDGENVNGPKWVEISDDEEEKETKSKSAKQFENGAKMSGLQPGSNVGIVSQKSGSSEGGNVKGRGGRKKTVARNYKKGMGREIPRSPMGAVQDSINKNDGETGESSVAGAEKVSSESGNVGAVEFMDGDDDLMACLEDL